MSDYINGYSYPKIVIKDVDTNETINTIELSLCGAGGLVENYVEDFKRIELESGRYIDYDYRGSRISFQLDYSEYIRKTDLALIELIFAYNSQPETYKLILYPRADIGARYFEVRLTDGSFSLGILKGGINTVGHRLPVINFITTVSLGKNFLDPDLLYIPLTLKYI